MSPDSERTTYVLIDGENIDATLGASIFGRRPQPNERPRWERILTFAEATWGQPVEGPVLPRRQGRAADELHPGARRASATGRSRSRVGPTDKVVDIAIQRTLAELESRDADLMLVSNDGDFLPQMERLLDGRRMGLLAFREFKNSGFNAADRAWAGVLRPGVRRRRVQRAAAPPADHPDRRVRPERLPLSGRLAWCGVRRPAPGRRSRAPAAPAAPASRTCRGRARSAVCASVITRLRRATPTSRAARLTAGP